MTLKAWSAVHQFMPFCRDRRAKVSGLTWRLWRRYFRPRYYPLPWPRPQRLATRATSTVWTRRSISGWRPKKRRPRPLTQEHIWVITERARLKSFISTKWRVGYEKFLFQLFIFACVSHWKSNLYILTTDRRVQTHLMKYGWVNSLIYRFSNTNIMKVVVTRVKI